MRSLLAYIPSNRELSRRDACGASGSYPARGSGADVIPSLEGSCAETQGSQLLVLLPLESGSVWYTSACVGHGRRISASHPSPSSV